MTRALAALVLVAPFAVNWRAGLLALGAAATLLLDERPARSRSGRAAVVLLPGLGIASLFAFLPSPGGAPSAALVALVLLPAGALAALAGSPRALGAALLALGGASALGGTSALAPALALAAFSQLADPERERWLGAAQGAWSAALLGATALLAAYPWLRPEPLRAALDAVGLDPARVSWPWLALPLLVAALAWPLAGRLRLGGASIAGAFLLAAATVVWRGAERRVPLVATEMVLGGGAGAQTLTPPDGAPVGRSLVVDSALLDGAELAAGTAVAEIVVARVGGAVERLTLRAGSDTGEWAARRGDLRAAGLAPAPTPWIAWVAGTAPPIFGQRYRARFTLSGSGALGNVVVARAPSLPDGTTVVLYGLEIVP